MTTTVYIQSKLVRGDTFRTAWVPVQFAIIGKSLDLKINGAWTNGWLVEEVYPNIRMDDSEVIYNRDLHRRFIDKSPVLDYID